MQTLPLFNETRSLKARLTLWTMVVVGLCSALLAIYVKLVLGQGLEKVLAAQQRDATLALANQIDRQLGERQTALEQVASNAGLQTNNKAALQKLLNDRPVFQNQFSGGSLITDTAGVVIASYPETLPRLGVSSADRDYIAQPLATGRSAIGRPTLDRVSNKPVVAMSSPIFSASGEVIGVLAGLIDLNQPGFLNAFKVKTFSDSSSLLIVSSRDRMVVAATDLERLLAKMPPVGVNPTLDQFATGFEGSSIFVDPRGVKVLATVKQLKYADWYLVMSLPTDEVFAPAQQMMGYTLASIAMLALIAATLTWQLMRRQLAPLGNAADVLGRLTPDQVAFGKIPQLTVTRQDEIGVLIQAFNKLVDELTRQRRELMRSETLYSTAFRTSPDAICISKLESGVYVSVNDNFERMFGWSSDEVVGDPISSLWRHPQDRPLFVEMLRRDGHCALAEIEFVTRDGSVLTAQIAATLITLDGEDCALSVIHDLSARRRAQAEIKKLAFSDSLTGLANRRLFMDHLRQVEAESMDQQAALLYINMDDFNRLNERLGLEQCDQILREVAVSLSTVTRVGDTLARLAGDEFAVILRDLSRNPGQAQLQAEAVGNKLLKSLREMVANAGGDYVVGASIGLALLGDNQGQAFDALRRANIAMSYAKSQGGDQLCLFESAMQDQLIAHAALESELRSALKTSDQFVLFYQPQVDQEGAILGAEALVRWVHPMRGLVPPAEFIQAAEGFGLIVELGTLVLKKACIQLALWHRHPSLSHLKVSVNVSSKQFVDPNFIQLVFDEVASSGIDPSRLMLELTESLLVNDIDDVIYKMAALRKRGIRFALDDFGTGFSSLAYLKQLPFNELKIDQSFVRDIELDPNDLAIARTVVELGGSLGMAVLAEGVETVGQRDLLIGIGCRRFQGYLFGRPLPVHDFEALSYNNLTAVIEN